MGEVALKKEETIDLQQFIPVDGKKPVINKFMKKLLFSGWKRQKHYKALQKEMGTIDTVNIIITPKGMAIEAENENDREEVPFTPEEKVKFLKMFNIKPEQLKDSKHVFIMLDMHQRIIYIQNTKFDGTVNEYTI